MQRIELGFSLLIFSASLAAIMIFAAAGWPGAPNHCVAQGDCYCEATRPGPIAQPANTWSLLAFSFGGFWVAWHSGRARRKRGHAGNNRMLESAFYPALFAGIIVFMGPGGMLFHASLTDWGGAVDVLSMFLWINFLLFYDLASIFSWDRSRFLVWYLVATTLFMIPRVLYGPSGVPLFALVFTAWVLIELAAAIGSRRPELWPKIVFERDRRWLVGHLATSIVAFTIWNLSHGGGPLCKPDSLLQGHAVWHVLNAMAFVMIYPYLRSERPRKEA
jgi:hypothetical protein